jgi:hypothetical protein
MSSQTLYYQKKLTNFFNFSNVESTYQSVELLKKSKKLILDTVKYFNYSTFYNKLTMKHTFKIPEVTDYPIQTNETIIPIHKNKKRNINLGRKLVLSDQINESFAKKIKDDFNNNFPIIEKNAINSKTFLNYIDKFNNMDGVIHKYITYKEKYFVNKNKDGNKSLLEEYMNKNIDNDNIIEPFNEPVFKKENIFKIKNTEVKLRCDSIILYFYEEDTKKKISKIKFPFECIPFFYGIDFDSFKLFIFSVIGYDYKINQFKLNISKFNQAYNNYLVEKKLYNDDCYLLNYSQNPSFKYDWIVQSEKNTKKYKLKIQMPKMKVRFKYFNNIKTTLIKSLDSTRMSYLILENFKDWDLFLLNSFCIIKQFRKTINQALSYSLLLNKKNLKFDLDDPKIKLNKNNYSTFSSVFFITFQNESLGKNIYFEINTPKIKVNYKSDNVESYEKIYNLNIKEAIQLNKMRKSFWPEDMINRCLSVREESKKVETTLELDQKIFDFDNDLLKYIKRQDNFFSEIIRNKAIIKITIIFPSISFYNSTDLNQKKYNLSRDEFEELFEMPIINWYKYVITNFKKIKNLNVNKTLVNQRKSDKKNTSIPNSLRNVKRIRQKSLRNSIKSSKYLLYDE